MKLLLEKSEKRVPYLGSKDGKKIALHIASFHHHSEILEEILSHSPGCREHVDDDGNNVIHFAMMKNAGDNSWLSNYLKIKWLATRGLVTEKDARGNTPLHLLSSFQNDPVRLVGKLEVDTKEYSNENSTAYNRTWGAKEEILGAKVRKTIISLPSYMALENSVLCWHLFFFFFFWLFNESKFVFFFLSFMTY